MEALAAVVRIQYRSSPPRLVKPGGGDDAPPRGHALPEQGLLPGSLGPGVDDQAMGQLIPPAHQRRSSVQQHRGRRRGPDLPRLKGPVSITLLDLLDDLPNFPALLRSKLVATAHILHPIPLKLMFCHKG